MVMRSIYLRMCYKRTAYPKAKPCKSYNGRRKNSDGKREMVEDDKQGDRTHQNLIIIYYVHVHDLFWHRKLVIRNRDITRRAVSINTIKDLNAI